MPSHASLGARAQVLRQVVRGFLAAQELHERERHGDRRARALARDAVARHHDGFVDEQVAERGSVVREARHGTVDQRAVVQHVDGAGADATKELAGGFLLAQQVGQRRARTEDLGAAPTGHDDDVVLVIHAVLDRLVRLDHRALHQRHDAVDAVFAHGSERHAHASARHHGGETHDLDFFTAIRLVEEQVPGRVSINSTKHS